jgi:invasion protein IalB
MMMKVWRLCVGATLMLSGWEVALNNAVAQDDPAGAPVAVPHRAAVHQVAPVKPASKPKPAPATEAQHAAGGRTPPQHTTRFGNWAVTCAPKKAPTDPADCTALVSVAKDKDDKRAVIVMGVSKHAGQLTFFAHTPTNVSIKPGVDVQFEGKSARHFDFVSCEPPLCTISSPADDAILDEIVTTSNATFLWTTLAVGPFKVAFPTASAKEAIDFLKAQ